MLRQIVVGVFVLGGLVSASADVSLRIVTYNIYQGIANNPSDRTACGNLLTSFDFDGSGPNTSLMPDIVCLQETTNLGNLESFRDDYLPDYQVIKGPTTDGFYSCGYFFRGDLAVLHFDEFGTSGPRPLLRLVLDVPGTDDDLVVYTAHLKAGQDASDIDTRRLEANAIANRIAIDVEYGIDLDDNGSHEFFPVNYVFAGDFNQDDFSDDVIDPFLDGGSNGLPTGLNDVRLETLYGAQFPTWLGNTYSTRYSLSRRYDYILVSDAIYARLDADGDGTVDQDELNAAGFVYISADDSGLHASGDTDATTVGSDHAPVLLEITIATGIPGDIDGDGDVDLADLSILLAHYGQSGVGPDEGDLDGDGDVDLGDLSILLANYGTGT